MNAVLRLSMLTLLDYYYLIKTLDYHTGELRMSPFRCTLSLVLSFTLLCVSMGQAQAAIIANDQLIQQTQQASDRAALLQTVQRADVQKQLLHMGVNSADIESRISQMTAEEVAQLNQQINELPAGGDVLGIIVLIFIVFVVTDVIGATDIFPFIHPVN